MSCFEGLTAEQVAKAQAAVAQWPPLVPEAREELRALFTEPDIEAAS